MFVTGYRKYSALSGGMWKVDSGILNKGIGSVWRWHENSNSCDPFYSDWLRVYHVSAVPSDWLRGVSELDDRLWCIAYLVGKKRTPCCELSRIDICNFIRYYLQHCNYTYIYFSETDFLTHNTVNFYSGFLNEKQECKISEIIDNLLLQRSWSSSILQWTEMLLLHLKNFFRVLRKVK